MDTRINTEDMMMRIGIIGTGRIAGRCVQAIQTYVPEIHISCVYNPSIESAIEFANRYNIKLYTSDWNILMNNVDAVYIASPHETHYTYSRMALECGRHVICEKPAALKKNQVQELTDMAASRKLVYMEALKTEYCSGYKSLIEAADSGKIGRIIEVEAAFTRLTQLNTREYMNDKYNGSFLELGSYVLLPVIELMGCQYDDITFRSVRAQNGVDTYTKAFIDYKDKTAIVKTGIGAKTEGQLVITGTNGYILAGSPWWLTKEYEIRYEDSNRKEVYKYEYEDSGLQYELREFLRRISDNEYKSDKMNNVSVAMAGVMEQFIQWNSDIYKGLNEQFQLKCKKKSMPYIWAHRGCCTLYPENTLEAFRVAAMLDSIKGIELDIQLTLDQQIVVFHDENLKRVTGIDKTVAECTLEEIKNINIPMHQGKDCKVPTLEEVLVMMKPYCIEKGELINIELKTSVTRYSGIEEKAMRLVKQYNMEDYIIWSSFLADSIKKIKELDNTAKTGALAVSLEECISMARHTDADALHPYIGGLIYELPDDMKDMPVRAWNMDEPFYEDGRQFKELHLDKYAGYGATDIFTNIPQNYIKLQR